VGNLAKTRITYQLNLLLYRDWQSGLLPK
jgi:hypothetical protein